MKTTSYNPSLIEQEFAQAIIDLQKEIQSKIKTNKIVEIQNNMNADNPTIVFKLQDVEGDRHELVVKFIQRLEE